MHGSEEVPMLPQKTVARQQLNDPYWIVWVRYRYLAEIWDSPIETTGHEASCPEAQLWPTDI